MEGNSEVKIMARRKSYLGSAGGQDSEIEGYVSEEQEEVVEEAPVEEDEASVEDYEETPVETPIEIVNKGIDAIEAEPVSHNGPDFEKIARVLYMYLEEINAADEMYYKDHSMVRGVARRVAAKRLKWGTITGETIQWKV
jgi:hypothetical protein